MFSSSPMRLVDDRIIAKLDGNTCKVLLVIQRFLDLTNQIRVGKRALLSGWTLCISHDRIAQLANLSRRTVIRKIKILADAGIITLKKWGRACKYLFMEFHNEIQKLEDEYAQKQAFEEELANLSDDNDDADASDSDAPNDDAPDGDNGGESVDDSPIQAETPNSSSDAPNDDAPVSDGQGDQTADPSTQPPPESKRNGAFVNRNRVVLAAPVTHLTPYMSELSHIKETFIIEIRTLSSKVSKLFKIVENNQTPKYEREKRQQQENDWQNHTQYAQLFYGEISSKKFHKDACLYFKQKAEEFGVSEDGQDRLMLAIPKIKSYGARSHVAFDYEFGVRAYNEVLDEEKLRKNAPDNMGSEEQQHQRNKRNAYKMDYDIKTLFKHASPAAKRMAYAIESRHNAATAVGQKGYSDAQIVQMWERAYAEYGEPQSHDQWTDDRFACHQLLVAKGVRKPLDNEETQVIIEHANKLFAS